MSDTSTKIRELCASYNLTDEQLKNVQKVFTNEIRNGLGKLTHDSAHVKCHITYITSLPDGTERGKYLALDLGGTNFRVLLVDLFGERKYDIKSKIYTVPTEIMSAPAEKLFDLIVNSLQDFINTNNLNEFTLPMGFTFSFPVNQINLTSGTLVRWTKGFSCPGVVDKDVVELLNAALKRNGGIKVKAIALLNDTAGTLMSCALENCNCKIGLIVGTGMNACYLEKISQVERWDTVHGKPDHVIINLECGAFGENGCIDFIRTEEDQIIDETSLNKGQQFLEKMTAGMYMGEMVRLLMLKMVKEKLLFDGHESDVLNTYDSFHTAYLSEIESDTKEKANIHRILKEFRLDNHATEEDLENILFICQCVSKRSAYLVSAIMATLLMRINENDVTIGIDGTVYRLHPHYHDLMVEKIKQLIPADLTCQLRLSEDGSGKGAAVIAAVVSNE